jgi:hypothetical protein
MLKGSENVKRPKCGKKKYVPFTCKCRLCTSCGTKAANEWADEIHQKLLRVPHRSESSFCSLKNHDGRNASLIK